MERSPNYLNNPRNTRVAVIGAGPVGSLMAAIIGQKGYAVDVYEFREDIRRSDKVKGRTINLALSTRGIAGLRRVGLDEIMIKHNSIPMRARFLHNSDGTTKEIPYDPLENKSIYSVERKYLNELLITEAEKNDVTFHFEHKLVHINIDTNTMLFEVSENKDKVEITADLIIGADGAFSAIRREMMKQPMFDFSQTYIEHGYLELRIPPTDKNEFAMPKNYLHIWPRNTFMMIALPNRDCSWTVSLFMPFKQFRALESPAKVIGFFKKYFPDAIPLIGEATLVQDFLSTKPSTLVSIKCNPYNKSGNCILIGDAAHAMVPFYGQGLNAGFEDCCILDDLFSENGNNFDLILDEFTKRRKDDAAAICDLAMYNYIEMRDLVTKNSFLWRKKLDNFLYKIFPSFWTPLYNTVTFSRMRYSDCIKNKEWQDKMITNIISVVIIFITLGVSRCIYEIYNSLK